MPRLASTLAFLLIACRNDTPVECETGTDCLQGGVPGVCLESPASAKKWCAFPDPSCDGSGQRWGVLSGDGLASECVTAMDIPDAGSGERTLTIERAGSGSGRIFSQPAGIDCGSTCSANFGAGTTITLRADVGPDTFFSGWSSECAPVDATSCSLALALDTAVSATLERTGETRWLVRHGPLEGFLTKGVFSAPSGDVIVIGDGLTGTANISGNVTRRSGSDGHVMWSTGFVQQAPLLANGDFEMDSIAVTADGDVVVFGKFAEKLVVGDTTLTATGFDFFLVKLAATDGSVLWSKNFGDPLDGADADQHQVAVDPLGDIIAVGPFSGSLTLAGSTQPANGSANFMAKFTGGAGTEVWFTVLRSDVESKARGLCFKHDGSAYAVAGSFRGTLSLPGAAANAMTKGGDDAFWSVHSASTGLSTSLQHWGGLAGDSATSCVFRDNGEALVLASAGGSLTTPGITVAAAGGAFVARVSAAGSATKAFEESLDNFGVGALGSGPGDRWWLAGSFSGTVMFAGSELVSTSGSSDGILLKLVDDEVVGAWRFGGAGPDVARYLTTGDRSATVAGQFDGLAEFSGTNLTEAGSEDTFVWTVVP